MNNQTKKGFSLVEIMILFAVLAVIMAASLPILSRKSKPVPTKITHGVYRCIANPDGLTYTEEIYNSFRRISHTPDAESCRAVFTVPNSSVYKVDLYGAGAGGTKYAAYKAEQNDKRSSAFKMENAIAFAKGNGETLKFSDEMANELNKEHKDMPFVLKDEDIKYAFGFDKDKKPGEIIMTYAYSANAASGGDSKHKYVSPADAICTAADDNKYREDANDALETAKGNTTTAQGTYDNRLKQLKADYEALKQRYDTDIPTENTNLENRIKTYEGYQNQLNTYKNDMQSLINNYNIIKSSSSSTDEREKAYANFVSIAQSDAKDTYHMDTLYTNINSYDNSRSSTDYDISMSGLDYKRVYNSAKRKYEWVYVPYGTYDNLLTPLGKIKTAVGYVTGWKNGTHNVTETNEDGTTSTRSATTDEIFDDMVTQQASNIKTITDNAQIIVSAINSYTTITDQIKDMNQKIEDNNKELKKLPDKIKAAETAADEEKSTDADFVKAKKELKEAKDKETERQNIYNAVNQEKSKYLRPDVYKKDDAKNYMYDYDNMYTAKQIQDYCKSIPDYKEYYDDANHSVIYHLGANSEATEQYKSQSGGSGGSGIYLQLAYHLVYGEYEQGVYASDAYSAWKPYPFVKYIGDLAGNVNSKGYAEVSCSDTANMNSNTCKSNGVKSGATVLGKTVFYDSETAKEYEQDSSNSLINRLVAKKGGDVLDFAAYRVPDFKGGYEYKTIQKTKATGGEGGVTGFIKHNKTYEENSIKPDNVLLETNTYLSENYGWQTFSGSGTDLTKQPDTATSGTDATAKTDPTIKGSDSKNVHRYTISLVEAKNRMKQEPMITQEANLWSKKYKVGRAGTPGQHVHFQASSLGDHCNITVNQRGPMFDYMALSKEVSDPEKNPDGLSVSEYLSLKKAEYEENLETKLECFDKQNNPVLEKIAKGGIYNIVPTDWKSPFFWYKGVKEHVVTEDAPNEPETKIENAKWKWIRIFHKIADALTEFNVSKAGTATQLTDSCVKEKGTQVFKVYRLTIKGDESTWTETEATEKYSGNNPLIKNTFVADGWMEAPEGAGKADCYRDDEGAYTGVREFDTDVQSEDNYGKGMTAAEAKLYNIKKPDEAGGGAIVIVW